MGELVTTEQRTDTMKAMIAANDERIVKALPDFMQKQAKRFMQVVVEATLDPKIIGADPISVLASVIKAAQCGLPLDGVHAALVPFKEHGTAKAQFIPMFQGLIVTAMRNGGVKSIWSSVVYEGDDFEEVRGSEPKLIHKPSKQPNRSIDKAQYVYACARLTSGDVVFEVLDAGQVGDIKSTSKAKSGPWSNATQEAEMWRKTAVRRLAKYLPKSPDLQAALDNDDEFEPFNHPHDAEFEIVQPQTGSTAPKRDLADLVPPNRNGQPAPTQSKREDPPSNDPPPIRWHAGIEISLSKPFERWADQKLNSEGPLNGLTYRQVASSGDAKVRQAVDEALKKGALIQEEKGQTPAAFQKLAEARRALIAAGPLGENAPRSDETEDAAEGENRL